jgi:hypothetical protein
MPTVAEEYDHVVGVDTHAASHTMSLLTAATGGVVEQRTFPTSPAGLQRALTGIRSRTHDRTCLVGRTAVADPSGRTRSRRRPSAHAPVRQASAASARRPRFPTQRGGGQPTQPRAGARQQRASRHRSDTLAKDPSLHLHPDRVPQQRSQQVQRNDPYTERARAGSVHIGAATPIRDRLFPTNPHRADSRRSVRTGLAENPETAGLR